MTPTPTLILNTLGALAFFRERDEGCPGLKHWQAELHQLSVDTAHYDHDPIVRETALDHLNTTLGEVMVWLNTEIDDLVAVLRCGVGGWTYEVKRDQTGSWVGYLSNELTAKCELVVAAAVASGWEGKVE